MIHFGFRALMSCKRFGFSKVSTTLSRGWNLYRPFLLKDEWVTSDSRLPKIDLLFVATRKDFSTLGFALVNAQKGSKNEIEKITIIVPSDDVVECKRLLKHLNTKDLAPVAVIDETVLIAAEVSQSLRDKFGARFGWILQQLLKVSNILKSEAAGVLVVDADTVLLKERTWLDCAGNQVLLTSSEYNEPYYTFLHSLGLSLVPPITTHVTHHMLMQPLVLKEILKEAGVQDVEKLAEVIVNYPHQNLVSPVSLDYELYAQGLLKLFPEKAILLKFGNKGITLNRSTNADSLSQSIEVETKLNEYFSVSYHSYLQG